MSVVVIKDISQTILFHWYITCGLLIFCYHFRKVQFFSGALRVKRIQIDEINWHSKNEFRELPSETKMCSGNQELAISG